LGSVPTTPWHFPPDCCICLSVLNVPLGNLLVAPSFGVAAIFRFLLFFRFHNWTLNLPHDGLRCVGGALLCAIHGATVENTLFEDGDASNTFRAFNPTQGRNLLDGYRQPVLVTDFGIAFQQALAALLHVCASHGLVDERCGRLALNLRLTTVSQELRAAEDPEFETFYTKNILLRASVLGWLLRISPMSNSHSLRRSCPVETPYNAPLAIVLLLGGVI